MASSLFASSNPYSTPLLLNPRAERIQRRQLTPAELDEVHFAFNTLDQEKTGFVSARQTKVGLPVEKQ